MERIGGVTDLQPIGRGGTSVVYRGRQSALGRTVAVKVLDTVPTPDQQTRFERECHAIGSLSGHPNVVTVHDAGLTPEGHPFLVMEHLPRTLADTIAERGRLDWHDAVALGQAVASALGAAHRQSVLHRDVKPQNVLMTDAGVPKLTDFGLARYTGTPESRTSTVTASFAHASPEMVQGGAVDERSDVYALASTLHEAMSGAPPFVRPGDESLVPIITRIVTEPPPALARFGVPAPVEDVLRAAMAKDPAQRPATAEAFANQLAAAAQRAGAVPSSGAPETAPILTDTIEFRRRPAASPPPAAPALSPVAGPARRRRWSLLGALAALAVLVAGGVAWAVNGGGDDAGTSASAGPVTTAASTVPTTTPAVTETASATSVASTGTTTSIAITTLAGTTSSDDTTTTLGLSPPAAFTVTFDGPARVASISGSGTADDAAVLIGSLAFLTSDVDVNSFDTVEGTSPDRGTTADVARQLLEAMQTFLVDGTLVYDGAAFTVTGRYVDGAHKTGFETALASFDQRVDAVINPVELTPAPTTTTTTTTAAPSGGVRIVSFSSETGSKTFTIPADGNPHDRSYTIVASGGQIGYYCPTRSHPPTKVTATDVLAGAEVGNCFSNSTPTSHFTFTAYVTGSWKFTLWVCDGDSVNGGQCTEGKRSSNSVTITVVATAP